MTLMRQAVERARMTAEDLRGKAFSPYPARSSPSGQRLTWHELAVNKGHKCEELRNRVATALSVMRRVRETARLADDNPQANHRRVLKSARNNVIYAMEDLGASEYAGYSSDDDL